MGQVSETPIRVYAVYDGSDEPDFLGAADDVSLGDLLRDLHKRGVTDSGCRVGIMYRPVDGQPGEWLVNPWA